MMGKFIHSELNCEHGQERNQFAEVDSQLFVLGLRCGRGVAGGFTRPLRLEGFLTENADRT
jgi:hypothetical protein